MQHVGKEEMIQNEASTSSHLLFFYFFNDILITDETDVI
jgi:hypothetical protein